MFKKKAAPKIIDKTKECIQKAQEDFSGQAEIDTRWSHMRNGSQSLTTVIDPVTRKVNVAAHQVKEGGNRFMPICRCPSNMMESSGTIAVLNEFKVNGILDQITTITRDRDNKSDAIFQEFGLEDKQRHDSGDYKKNFRALFQSFTSCYDKTTCTSSEGTTKTFEHPFYGLDTP